MFVKCPPVRLAPDSETSELQLPQHSSAEPGFSRSGSLSCMMQEADRMSRFPLKFATRLSLLGLVGCMYPPMYQQSPYGSQQMYSPPGSMAPSGTIVVPPSNAPFYTPGGSTYSTPGTPSQPDDFSKPAESKDPRFFGAEDDKVPLPSDPGGSTRPFLEDLGQP